ncbi:MAG TPA: secondary thiamine-phosphate synthase enzyme YjbQ [Candidatus Xenobia bacterium]|nr:secondary thiamine-phosphate synthase enzyme YjbQ [Candidatus Xenobia bacterium]
MSQKPAAASSSTSTLAEHFNGFRIKAETLTVSTRERLELINITERLAEQVRSSGIREGLAVVSSLHTTLALFINEFQGALLDDIRTFLEESVVRNRYYKHNDPAHSDCDRLNADAHLRALLLGHSLALPVRDGELLLGTYQSVILAELDGPRERALQIQILGMA